ncbi:uncharacterized protein LOC103389224 [Cynoglossus semilaevis]|uniref:Uncharacterized LOC103389224 n=1 Tax=Cynoglossus semilaevis TaxID=244447 RepID=A0A3P8UDA0_CYNSE|nr:uncharacterized protein LOC103389224 [Cynoglossus semilaevis]
MFCEYNHGRCGSIYCISVGEVLLLRHPETFVLKTVTRTKRRIVKMQFSVNLFAVLIFGHIQHTTQLRGEIGIVVSSPWEVDGQCWTDWFNDDDPSIDGDSETLTDLLTAHPDQICLEPIEIQVRTESGENMESTGDVIFVANTSLGFICNNADQADGMCEDYQVRFQCPVEFCDQAPKCWTEWFSGDEPTSGNGDFETLSFLQSLYPGLICNSPLKIQVKTVLGATVESTRDLIAVVDATTGFICYNTDQPHDMCQNYQVRFQCPSSFCTGE